MGFYRSRFAKITDRTFAVLAQLIGVRNQDALHHATQVADYAAAIAQAIALGSARIEQIWQAGFLHDVGKVGIPDLILLKPDRLTDEEYGCVKTHVQLGGDLLETMPSLAHLAPFVRHHHERWDGMGYPRRLKGTQIPLESRILGLCDAVDAMTSDRPYHCAKSRDAVIAEVSRCAGLQFDPTIVRHFLRLVNGDPQFLTSAKSSAMASLPSQIGEPPRGAFLPVTWHN